MKKFILFIFLAILFTAYSANPPLGKTAAPQEGYCGECHRPSSDKLNGSIEISGIPSWITPLTTYPINVTILNPDTTIKRGGFELTILDAKTHKKVGNFINKATSTNIRSNGSRQYLSHGPAKNFGAQTSITYSADWEALDLSLIDSIKIYASCVLANGSGSPSGDTPLFYRSSVKLPKYFKSTGSFLKNNKPSLSWHTYDSNNLDYYTIDWSMDDVNYIRIVSKNKNYKQNNYTHSSPKGGMNFYKINFVSKAGGIKVSETIRQYVFEKTPTKDIVFTPFSINFTDHILDERFVLYDVVGNIVKVGYVGNEIDIRSLISGVYILNLKGKSYKFIK